MQDQLLNVKYRIQKNKKKLNQMKHLYLILMNIPKYNIIMNNNNIKKKNTIINKKK